MEENSYKILNDYENVDWEKVIPILMAFAHKLLSQQNIRNKRLDDLAYDFTMEAIRAFLEGKEKFDSSRNPDLLLYLKYNLLRRIISNYSKSGANSRISSKQIDDLPVINQLIEDIPIDEIIDVKEVVQNIQKEIDHDEVMSIIFIARYEENMKRSEICKEFSIETANYDNAMKRLKRIVEKHLN